MFDFDCSLYRRAFEYCLGKRDLKVRMVEKYWSTMILLLEYLILALKKTFIFIVWTSCLRTFCLLLFHVRKKILRRNDRKINEIMTSFITKHI